MSHVAYSSLCNCQPAALAFSNRGNGGIACSRLFNPPRVKISYVVEVTFPPSELNLATTHAPIASFHDENVQLFVLDVAGDSVISDTVAPVAEKLRSKQGFAEAARIFQGCYALLQVFQKARARMKVHLIQVPLRCRIETNPVCHTSS